MIYTDPIKNIRPDSRFRVPLGDLAKGIDGFKVFKDDAGRIILEPYADVPLHEIWVFENPEIIAKLDEGHKQIKNGQSRPIDWSKWEDEDK